MLGTLGFTSTQHWAPYNFSYSTTLNKGKSSIEGLSESTCSCSKYMYTVQLYNYNNVLCLQCSIKKWSWQVLIGNR